MPRQNLNMDGKIGGEKDKVRKRRCSSSSSSSLTQNNRLKRMFLVGKRGGSSTPFPMWKMTSSDSQTLEYDKGFKNLAGKNGEKAKEFSASARKLAAILWKINGLPSPGVKSQVLEDRVSEVGMDRKERILNPSMEIGSSYPFHGPVTEKTDPSKSGSHGRRAPDGSLKLLQADCNLSLHNCLMQVKQIENHVGLKNHLKDVHKGLITSKELLKLLNHICCVKQLNSKSLPLVSALKVELDRAFTHVDKLIQRQNRNSEIDILFEKEKELWRSKEQKMVLHAIKSISGELEIEKKLRRHTEKLNKKLRKELAVMKASLSRATKELDSEKRARQIVEEACNELARGIGREKAELKELKRQSTKVWEEVEREREMFQLAEVLREERVQMKLSEAKCLLEEKNALLDKLRNELEAYLKSKKDEEQCEKTKELEKYLKETYQGSYQNKEIEREAANKGNKEEEDDSGDSDLCSIELKVDETSKSFRWGNATFKNGSKRSSVDKSKGRNPISEETEKTKTNQRENLNVFDSSGLFGFTSIPKKDVEEDMERYKMIKDLRDNIVSGSRIVSSQEFVSSS